MFILAVLGTTRLMARGAIFFILVAAAATGAAAAQRATAGAAAEPPTVVVIQAARLIDGRGGEPLAPAMVRVEGGRISAVASSLPVPSGARLINLGDATLLPGFIDLHTHLTGRSDVHWEDALVKTTPAEEALWGAHNALITLLAGFTTVRDMGPNWPYTDVALRNAIEAGAVPGPRMLVAGAYVSSTGGAGDASQFSPYVQVPLVHNLADGPEEITKAVRTNFKNGADFIKILATGAVLSKGILPGRNNIRMRKCGLPWWRRADGGATWRPMLTAPRASRRRSVPGFTPSTMVQGSTTRQWPCSRHSRPLFTCPRWR